MERDWENLPKHLLDSVAEKLLIPSDYLGFSLACKSWYSVAKDNKSKHFKMTAPLLLFYTGRKDYWKFYNIIDKKVLDLEVRAPNQPLAGSSKGWLIFMKGNAAHKGFDMTLVNPFFRVRGRREKENSIIRLPSLKPPVWEEWYGDCDNYIQKFMLTADPIMNPKDCIVMVIHLERRTLAFLRLEKDTKWTFVDERVENAIDRCGLLEEVITVGSKFYAVGHNWSQLFSFDVTTESYSDMKLVCKETINFSNHSKRYIFEGEDNKLWMVIRYLEFGDCKRITTKFEVFQFDCQTGEWIGKSTLGDVALFVGNNTSICLPTSSNNSGLHSNCIYFSHDCDLVGYYRRCYDFGVYNVEDKQFIQVYPDHVEKLLKMCYPLPIWIVPTLNFHLKSLWRM